MRFINRFADRLLEKVAPTVIADAACKYIGQDTYLVRDESCPTRLRVRIVTHYDNCPSKTTSHCFG
jgi:hypothetical protein